MVANSSDPLKNDASSHNSTKEQFDNRNLRYIFVAFLFSAAMARLGDAAYEAYKASWLPAASHLLLAFVVITTSWISWAAGIREGQPIKNLFTLQTFVLAWDVLLVLLYMALVKTADVSPLASAVPESTLLFGIYLAYAVWDIIHDIVVRHYKAVTLSGQKFAGAPPRILQFIGASAVRCFASISCALVAFVIVQVAKSGKALPVNHIVLLNVAEMANAILFRSIKVVEFKFDRHLHPVFQEGDRYGDKKRIMGALAIAMSLAVVGCIGWILVCA